MAETAQETLPELMMDSGKLRVAELGRLLLDNQKTLNLVNGDDRRRRERQQRIEEAIAKQRFGDALQDPQEESEEDMQVRVDSPNTVNNYYPATTSNGHQTQTASTPLWKQLAIGAALLAAGGGATAIPLLWNALNSDQQQTAPAVDVPSYDVEKWVPE